MSHVVLCVVHIIWSCLNNYFPFASDIYLYVYTYKYSLYSLLSLYVIYQWINGANDQRNSKSYSHLSWVMYNLVYDVRDHYYLYTCDIIFIDTCIRSGEAQKKVHSDPRKYMWWVNVYKSWVTMSCPFMERFDWHSCDCVFDHGGEYIILFFHGHILCICTNIRS